MLEVSILKADMSHNKEDGYLGQVQFEVKGHKNPYEITFHSKNGKEWSYSLHFLNESGSEDEINSVDQLLEEDDESFDLLLNAARKALL